MKIIGIICEYNPFHNGHLYHIENIKKMYPDSIIILILNGYFLERGEISIINKKDKTEIALNHNVDIVVELPFVYGTQSADIFASKSIDLLHKLHAEILIFGSESNNLEALKEIASYQINEKDSFNSDVKKFLDLGLNYPTAMAKSLNIEFDFNPNDLLGISYIKRIIQKNYDIEVKTIKRTNDYMDTLSNDEIISATNIRKKLKNNEDIKKYLPIDSYNAIKNIDMNKFFDLLKYKIITEKDLSIYLDVDEGLDNRLKKIISEVKDIDELIKSLKSKRYTYNKISRMLIHILIGLTKEDNQHFEDDYIKILGFNTKGKKYLNTIKKDIEYKLNKDSLIYKYELIAAETYDLIANENNLKFEKSTVPIIKE